VLGNVVSLADVAADQHCRRLFASDSLHEIDDFGLRDEVQVQVREPGNSIEAAACHECFTFRRAVSGSSSSHAIRPSKSPTK
jgi:hypothetical protein